MLRIHIPHIPSITVKSPLKQIFKGLSTTLRNLDCIFVSQQLGFFPIFKFLNAYISTFSQIPKTGINIKPQTVKSQAYDLFEPVVPLPQNAFTINVQIEECILYNLFATLACFYLISLFLSLNFQSTVYTTCFPNPTVRKQSDFSINYFSVKQIK